MQWCLTTEAMTAHARVGVAKQRQEAVGLKVLLTVGLQSRRAIGATLLEFVLYRVIATSQKDTPAAELDHWHFSTTATRLLHFCTHS